MKIAMSTHGTRGDVQPFVSVALALMARGHDVTLGTPVNLLSFVERCGVRASRLALDSQAFMESPQGRAWLRAGDAAKFMKELSAITHAHRDDLIADTERLTAGADVLVAGILTEDLVSTVAEARGLPMLALHFNPMRSNSAYANGLVTTRALPGFLNRATHALADVAWWKGFREDVNHYRARLGLPPTTRSTAKRLAERGTRTLHAFSPNVVPPPAEYAAMPVIGSIRFPDAARARLGETARDPDLEVWLKAGPPPVFFGMGSMPVEQPEEMLRLIASVSTACDVRALVGAGWSRFEAARHLRDRVRIVGAVDHGWLLPQCVAAVHHGGAGTVTAALGAGLPAVVVSVFADQPFWGSRLERMGVGVHLPFKELGAASLERALRRVLAADIRQAAASLGALVRAEPDGADRAVEYIEALVPHARV